MFGSYIGIILLLPLVGCGLCVATYSGNSVFRSGGVRFELGFLLEHTFVNASSHPRGVTDRSALGRSILHRCLMPKWSVHKFLHNAALGTRKK